MPEEIEVPTEHLQEKLEEAAEELEHERAEEKKQHTWVSRVAVSSALLAVAAAISALLAGHHANEAMFEEMKATDQWALFQAKGTKASVLEGRIENMESQGKPIPIIDGKDARTKLKEYDHDKEKIQDKAKELDESAEDHMKHHVWFARAVTIFQIAIAMGAIAVLAKRPKLWLISVGLGALGTVFLAIGLM